MSKERERCNQLDPDKYQSFLSFQPELTVHFKFLSCIWRINYFFPALCVKLALCQKLFIVYFFGSGCKKWVNSTRDLTASSLNFMLNTLYEKEYQATCILHLQELLNHENRSLEAPGAQFLCSRGGTLGTFMHPLFKFTWSVTLRPSYQFATPVYNITYSWLLCI